MIQIYVKGAVEVKQVKKLYGKKNISMIKDYAAKYEKLIDGNKGGKMKIE